MRFYHHRLAGKICRAILVTALTLSLPVSVHAEYYDSYKLSPDAREISLAVQPLAYPLAFISSVMLRDRLLAKSLTEQGLTLKSYPFAKGNDIVPFIGDGRIEAAMLGDMPTVNAAIRTRIEIVGLGKRNFSSVVSRNYGRMEQLKGKRVGYSPGSSSHLVLLRGLAAAKMSEKDVVLVKLETSEMPAALEQGDVDAFSAWEPSPSISMSLNPKNRAIYRGMSTDWFALSNEFVTQHPAAADAMVAAFARAINWMRDANANVERAARWVLADDQAFRGKAPHLTPRQAIDIVHKDLLDVAGAPAVPRLVDGAPPLSREFAFLQTQGKVPEGVSEKKIRDAFGYDGLPRIQRDPGRYRIFEYDYDE